MQPKYDVIELLAKLVGHDTADPPGNEVEIARFIVRFLEENGVESELDEFLPGRANVLATIKGKRSDQALVFSSHLDTVPAGTQRWATPPLTPTIVDGWMYGRGTSDMKSALAAMMMMAIELKQEQAILPHDVILAFSAGESSNCLGSKRFMQTDALQQAGAVVVGEPSSLDVIVAHMGVVWVRVIVHGKMGHVSGSAGENAIDKMVDVIRQVKQLQIPYVDHALCNAPTINIGKIVGGTAVNVTADRCEIEVDVRVPPGTDLKVVADTFNTLASGSIEVEIFDEKPAVETSVESPIVKLGVEVCERINGRAAEISGVSYYSDATIYCRNNDLPFVIIGPGELGMSTQVDECVELDKVRRCVSIYKQMALSWHGVDQSQVLDRA
ncbi:M20 family metallopeptidase [Paraburkholderia sp. BCC1886]|uniref:M20 family metallopeptidase n=1 Tax=Paraburkholderia sp. BCC1886 TaxID=2562670 RepID=UPI001182C600|nr:M20 family metallopeptidase [Paraburkholderia sp. BCC1886]